MPIQDLIRVFFEFCCAGLVITSLFFIYLERKAGIGVVYRYFGVSILLLSLFSAIDIWHVTLFRDPVWVHIQHLLFAFIPYSLVGYFQQISDKPSKKMRTLFFNLAVFVSLLIVTDLAFINNGISWIGYELFFIPFVFFSILFLNGYLIRYRSRENATLKGISHNQWIGFLFLSVMGLVDMYLFIRGWYRESNLSFSFSLLGTIILSIALTSQFSKQLISLIFERNQYMDKLESAYKELEDASSLSEIGKTASYISHEVKNYTTSIIMASEIMEDNTDSVEFVTSLNKKINKNARALSTFTKGILNYSQASILKEKRRINLEKRILSTIDTHFFDKKKMFTLTVESPNIIVKGDWQKFDNVLLNIISNSFDAGATEISITIKIGIESVLLSIEDNGCGISDFDPNSIFKAFFTTKGSKGTGLGMAITKSIVQSHGGEIDVESKNDITQNESTGLIFTLTLPYFDDEQKWTESEKVAVLTERFSGYEKLIELFDSICIKPVLYEQMAELQSTPGQIVFGAPEIVGILNKEKANCAAYSISESERSLLAVGNDNSLYNGECTVEFLIDVLNEPVAS